MKNKCTYWWGQPLFKKGFTLIELLAVIIILAIIAVIAVPIVLNVIKETKEKSYDISVDNIVKAANLYDISSQLNDTTILMDQNIYEDLKKNLNGAVPDDGIVYLKSSITGKKREIAFALKYGEWCYTKAYGDPIYEKKKVDVCQVPFDYLIKGKMSAVNITSEDLFLWREEDTAKAIQRKQIESIEIKPSDKVSENAIYSWDVSENKTGKVMAWYEDIDKNGLYEVYIGQNGGVKAIDSVQNLFAHLPNAKTIDVKYLDTSQVTNMSRMFTGCKMLTSLDLSNFDTSKVGTDKGNIGNMSYMFSNCNNLAILDISSFNTENAVSMEGMFSSCGSLNELDLSHFNTKSVKNNGMSQMFYYCSKLKNLKLGSNFNTSNATNMKYMFAYCQKLTNLDVSNFDTGAVKDMSYMFYNCHLLRELDVSKWDTGLVTSMGSMFYGCYDLVTLDVSKWDTSSVEKNGMSALFCFCNELTKLDISNWNTSNVTNMSNMFNGCKSLKKLELSNFDTSQVTSMYQMFHGIQIEEIDVSNFNTNNVTNMEGMFGGTTNLTTIKIGCDWKTAENTTNMFTSSKYTLEQLNTLVDKIQASCITS